MAQGCGEKLRLERTGPTRVLVCAVAEGKQIKKQNPCGLSRSLCAQAGSSQCLLFPVALSRPTWVLGDLSISAGTQLPIYSTYTTVLIKC